MNPEQQAARNFDIPFFPIPGFPCPPIACCPPRSGVGGHLAFGFHRNDLRGMAQRRAEYLRRLRRPEPPQSLPGPGCENILLLCQAQSPHAKTIRTIRVEQLRRSHILRSHQISDTSQCHFELLRLRRGRQEQSMLHRAQQDRRQSDKDFLHRRLRRPSAQIKLQQLSKAPLDRAWGPADTASRRGPARAPVLAASGLHSSPANARANGRTAYGASAKAETAAVRAARPDSPPPSPLEIRAAPQ